MSRNFCFLHELCADHTLGFGLKTCDALLNFGYTSTWTACNAQIPTLRHRLRCGFMASLNNLLVKPLVTICQPCTSAHVSDNRKRSNSKNPKTCNETSARKPHQTVLHPYNYKSN